MVSRAVWKAKGKCSLTGRSHCLGVRYLRITQVTASSYVVICHGRVHAALQVRLGAAACHCRCRCRCRGLVAYRLSLVACTSGSLDLDHDRSLLGGGGSRKY